MQAFDLQPAFDVRCMLCSKLTPKALSRLLEVLASDDKDQGLGQQHLTLAACCAGGQADAQAVQHAARGFRAGILCSSPVVQDSKLVLKLLKLLTMLLEDSAMRSNARGIRAGSSCCRACCAGWQAHAQAVQHAAGGARQAPPPGGHIRSCAAAPDDQAAAAHIQGSGQLFARFWPDCCCTAFSCSHVVAQPCTSAGLMYCSCNGWRLYSNAVPLGPTNTEP